MNEIFLAKSLVGWWVIAGSIGWLRQYGGDVEEPGVRPGRSRHCDRGADPDSHGLRRLEGGAPRGSGSQELLPP